MKLSFFQNEFAGHIVKATEVELQAMMDLVVAERNRRRQAKKSTFSPGSSVWFIGRRGVKITGFVSKVNRKTVGVDAGNQGQWRVGPGILNHA